MIRRQDSRMIVSGAVTLANVAALLEEGRRYLAEGVRSIDFSEVTEMDSSALALCLAWLRDARAAGSAITFANLPDSLQTIARLYGVHSFLPVR